MGLIKCQIHLLSPSSLLNPQILIFFACFTSAFYCITNGLTSRSFNLIIILRSSVVKDSSVLDIYIYITKYMFLHILANTDEVDISITTNYLMRYYDTAYILRRSVYGYMHSINLETDILVNA